MTTDTTTTAATAVYLYGVARDLDPAALDGTPGVAAAPVRALTAPTGLTALVSTVRLDQYGEDALRANLEDLTFLEDTARAHHQVVDRAAHTAPTAPVRIATLYRDDDRVTRLLTDQHDHFTQILDAITGRTEWGIKAYAHAEAYQNPPTGTPTAPATATEPDTGGAGTAYLKRRQDERRRTQDATRRITEQAETLHADLAAHAAATRRHPPQDPRLSGHQGTIVLNVAYLVDDDHAQDFLQTARDFDDRLPGIEIQVTGPWPPYSFIEGTHTEGTRAAP
ncbi:GvpL/GvpF family gas vesicle protein [Actinomadura rugatobispora]|uniref:GvpL/GvpF family gas vesicle protein n=1 Tax=Actinomadura rugatobispora TaxID=1994 RepID=A0ABW1A3A2_9ACTN|nr:GvpL/GvpF family gas vesicle protein [Actinomadura rugatobispora]